MFRAADVYSLSEFQRNYSEHLERLRSTGRPELLTRNGKAALVVQDPDAYQALLDRVEDAETILALHRALQEAERGEGTPLEEALPRLRERLGIGSRVRE
jgi:PHD/YefM family antitoxin component YafN of YafNO toxin-antitoxin module